MNSYVLHNKWNLYYHLINNNDWSINSYVKLKSQDWSTFNKHLSTP